MTFIKGKSGNPGGLSAERRERLKVLTKALDDVFAPDSEGDPDKLVNAIAQGCADGDAQAMKLACEYRWGKPAQEITGADGGPIQVESAVKIYIPENGR